MYMDYKRSEVAFTISLDLTKNAKKILMKIGGMKFLKKKRDEIILMFSIKQLQLSLNMITFLKNQSRNVFLKQLGLTFDKREIDFDNMT